VKRHPSPAAPAPRAPSPLDLEAAWDVHRALVLAEARTPELKANPRWQLLRMDAFEDYHDQLTRSVRGI
jgi:hypothetical protein